MNKIVKSEKEEETKPSEEEQLKSELEVKEYITFDVNKHLQEVSKSPDLLNSVKVEREPFSLAEVLKYASGGLALEGIYNSDNLVLF